jgi:membrane-bound metal-dependent hydrolase YbcI (DUF457 family)
VVYAGRHDARAAAVLGLGVGVASLLPDVDSPGSTVAGWTRARWLVRLTTRRGILRHRSPLTHSLLACVVWPLLVAGALLVAGVAPAGAATVAAVLGVGGALHLLEDALPLGSRAGVPLLWPLSGRRYKLEPRPRPRLGVGRA